MDEGGFKEKWLQRSPEERSRGRREPGALRRRHLPERPGSAAQHPAPGSPQSPEEDAGSWKACSLTLHTFPLGSFAVVFLFLSNSEEPRK